MGGGGALEKSGWEVGVEGKESRIPEVVRSRGNHRGKLCNKVQYFAVKKSTKRWEPTKIGQD